MNPEALVEIARGVIVGVFVFAAVAKLRSLADFRRTFVSLGIGAPAALWILPRGVVVAELACAGALLTGPGTRVGFVTASVLLAVFAAVFIAVALQGADVRCNCFGTAPTKVGWPDVIRNVMLLAVALTGAATAASATGPLDASSIPALVTGVALAMTITSVRHVHTALRSDL